MRKAKGQWKARQEKHEDNQAFSKLPLHQQFMSESTPAMVSSPQGAALRKSKQKWGEKSEKSFSKLPLHQQFMADEMSAPDMVSSPQGAALRKSKQRWGNNKNKNGGGAATKLFSSATSSDDEDSDSLTPAEEKKIAELTARVSALENAQTMEDTRLEGIHDALDNERRAKTEALYQVVVVV